MRELVGNEWNILFLYVVPIVGIKWLEMMCMCVYLWYSAKKVTWRKKFWDEDGYIVCCKIVVECTFKNWGTLFSFLWRQIDHVSESERRKNIKIRLKFRLKKFIEDKSFRVRGLFVTNSDWFYILRGETIISDINWFTGGCGNGR